MGLLPFFAQILVSVGTILKIASSANPQVMLHQGCCPHAHVIPILPWLFLQAFIHILLYVPGYPGWTTRNRSVVQTRESTFPIAFHILAHGSWCHSHDPCYLLLAVSLSRKQYHMCSLWIPTVVHLIHCYLLIPRQWLEMSYIHRYHSSLSGIAPKRRSRFQTCISFFGLL